jgi:lipopolysaccharide biosynthesis regulator YciM
MDRAERLLEELSASREYRNAALDHLVRIYESQGEWANALKVFHELPPALQLERRRVAAHYLCELAEHALLQGDTDRARTLLRQACTHHAELPRADILAARITELAGDASGALMLYLKALEVSPGLALEIIPRVLTLAKQVGQADMLCELTGRLRRTGRVSARQLVWLLATALPPQDVRRLPGITGELGAGMESASDATSLSALLTRIGDAGGRYQCDDCGLHSVGWYWRCPKCRSWDSMRPAVFKWAERTDDAARAT